MLSNNYEKISELKEFLTNKLINSEKLNKKHKRYILSHKVVNNLSILNISGSIIFTIIKVFFTKDYSDSAFLMIPFLSLITGAVLFGIDCIIETKHDYLKVEYTHDDFVELSKILNHAEMNRFAEELEKNNSLFMWQKYLYKEPEKQVALPHIDTNIDLKVQNRKQYIDSLYNIGEKNEYFGK